MDELPISDSVSPLSRVDWNVISHLLTNLRDADPFLRLTEDGCFPETLNQLSALLRKYHSWPGDIRTSVHGLEFAIYVWAKDRPTQFPLRRLMNSVIDLAATDPDPENYVYPDSISQIQPLLLDYLVRSEYASSETRVVYLLKIFKRSPAQVNRSVWLDHDTINYLIDPACPLPVQYIGLEILSVACESTSIYLNEILQHLVSRSKFCDYILRAIGSQDSSRRTTGLRVLYGALSYLLSNEQERATWRERLGVVIPQIHEEDVPPESQFYLIPIKCALYPDTCSDELSTYWTQWMHEETKLKVARVAPVAQWVLANCSRPRPPAWYEELRAGFESLLQIAWGSDFEHDPAPLRELINCTDEWQRSEGLTYDTAAVVQATSDRILINWWKYDILEDVIDALERLRNLQ